MRTQVPHRPVVTVLGDVVGSRHFDDQAALIAAVRAVLHGVADRPPALQPLAVTVGDEFQGVYERIGEAVEAALRVRLGLLETTLAVDGAPRPVDTRVGIGLGTIEVSDPETLPLGQSGSAWWAAREALDAATDLAGKSQWPRSLRTVFRSEGAVVDGPVNAFLWCQDDLIGRMDHRDRRVLRGLLDGERQVDLARDLGVSQPAVARRQHDSGAVAIHRALEALRSWASEPGRPA